MSHHPKFTDLCQCLVNACQAAGQIKGASVTITTDAANHLTRALPPREFYLFDFHDNGNKTFTVWLKPQPQPQPPTP